MSVGVGDGANFRDCPRVDFHSRHVCPIADVPKFYASFAHNRINAAETSRSSALLNFAKILPRKREFRAAWARQLARETAPVVGARRLWTFVPSIRQSRRCNARLIKTKYIIRVLVTCGHGAIERSASCCFYQANTYRTVSTFTF
jgi:hypothetical protein